MTAPIRFIEAMAAISDPVVLELGTRRQGGQERTRGTVWVPHARESERVPARHEGGAGAGGVRAGFRPLNAPGQRCAQLAPVPVRLLLLLTPPEIHLDSSIVRAVSEGIAAQVRYLQGLPALRTPEASRHGIDGEHLDRCPGLPPRL
jgi:hypothetical protein